MNQNVLYHKMIQILLIQLRQKLAQVLHSILFILSLCCDREGVSLAKGKSLKWEKFFSIDCFATIRDSHIGGKDVGFLDKLRSSSCVHTIWIRNCFFLTEHDEDRAKCQGAIR